MTQNGLLLLTAAAGLAQLWHTARFSRLMRRKEAEGGPAPKITVLCACKGPLEGGGDSARTLLGQDYPGEAEFLFIVPSWSDPAAEDVRRVLEAQPGGKARLLCSDAHPERCSEQNWNLLHGLRSVDASTEVLVFADSDLSFSKHWLRALVAPLQDASVGASTATSLFMPYGGGFWDWMRAAWVGAGLPYFSAMGYLNGQSMAVRRKAFEACGVSALWERSINMDLTTAGALRAGGWKIAYAPGAAPTWSEPCSARAFFSGFGKWLLHFRLYGPLAWVLAWGLVLWKLYILYQSLRPPLWPGPVAALLFMDMLNLWWIFRILEGRFPEKFAPLGGRAPWLAALAAPLLIAAHAANLVFSATVRTLRWGGYDYRIRGPYDVKVLR
jgi:cellulose synthase/poly-beta-1,6-N-acetylglucosamine synthase-like glycosyltransferase